MEKNEICKDNSQREDFTKERMNHVHNSHSGRRRRRINLWDRKEEGTRLEDE